MNTKKDDTIQYSNFLEPSPKNQLLNIPYEVSSNENNLTFNTQPYSKDSCYLLDSKAQGVTGIVCNQAGGSDNADFSRGNQFGVDFNQIEQIKKVEYTVENPVQVPLQRFENPIMYYNKGNFYPEPSFDIRKNKNFKTYPLQNNYTNNGIPTYEYPLFIENFQNIIQKEDLDKRFIFIFVLSLFIFIFFIYSFL